MTTESGDLIVLGVQRRGEDIGPDEAVLAAGDTLLLQGTWKALDEHLRPERPRRRLAGVSCAVRRCPWGTGANRAIAVLLAMVVLLATGVVPPAVAATGRRLRRRGPGAASPSSGAFRAVNWTTVILVGAMMPLSTAMTQSGAAAAPGRYSSWRAVGDAGPYALVSGLFLLTAVLGQLISNTATALIVIPIAVAAAVEIGISPRSVLMSIAVAQAASFLTPIATPVNLIVMGPGAYRFGDYWKLGLPIMLWFYVVATFLVPVFWPF